VIVASPFIDTIFGREKWPIWPFTTQIDTFTIKKRPFTTNKDFWVSFINCWKF